MFDKIYKFFLRNHVIMSKQTLSVLVFLFSFMYSCGMESKKQVCLFWKAGYLMEQQDKTQTKSQEKKIISLGAVVIPLPKDIAGNMMIHFFDYQSIGRFGRTCHHYNDCYRDIIVCKEPQNSLCSSFGCSIFKNDFDACTKILAFHAIRYKKEKNDTNKIMFEHLWQHHACERIDGVAQVIGISDPTLDDCLGVYAGNCTSKKDIQNCNSQKLKKFLKDKNRIGIKTMLLSHQTFDEDDVLAIGVFLNDIKNVQALYKSQKKYNFSEYIYKIVAKAMSSGRKELTINLIKKYKDLIRDYRFCLWERSLDYWDMPNLFGKDLIYEILENLFFNDINAVDKDGASLLYFALKYPEASLVRFLLDKGAEVNLVSENEQYKQKDLLSVVLRKSRFFQGSRDDDLDKIIEMFLDSGIKVDAMYHDGETILHYYVRKFNNPKSSVIKKMFSRGVDPSIKNERGETVLHVACRLLRTEAIETLLQLNIDVNIRDNNGNLAVETIAEQTDGDGKLDRVMKLLLDKGQFGHNVDISTLVPRILSNHLLSKKKLIYLLIDSDAKIDTVDDKGNTILHHIYWYISNKSLIVEKLIKKGININAKNKDGKSALVYAIDGEFGTATEILLAYGADPNIVYKFCDYDITPLGQVFLRNTIFPDIAENLIKAGADIELAKEYIKAQNPFFCLSDVMTKIISKNSGFNKVLDGITKKMSQSKTNLLSNEPDVPTINSVDKMANISHFISLRKIGMMTFSAAMVCFLAVKLHEKLAVRWSF